MSESCSVPDAKRAKTTTELDTLRPDIHSFSNFKQFECTQIDLDVSIDFTDKVFKGKVNLTFRVIDNDAKQLMLDVESLNITSVTGMEYKIGESGPFGQELVLEIPDGVKDSLKVEIEYTTDKKAPGIQWLDAGQTTGGQHPFVFTQSQAIQARSILPCQDTPSVKCPFSCKITVPIPLFAIASGIPEGEVIVNEKENTQTFAYTQPMPVMVYLLAICAGNLTKTTIGPRSSVYAEPEMLKSAQWELDGITEEYILCAEKICGTPFLWGTYDVVMLPRSFAYGGMENPNAMFMSSALLAGDKSLTTTLAHEIVHSWCGNLVSNAKWKDFWLNEGFTRYNERRILEKLHGKAYRGLLLKFGYFELVKTCNYLEKTPELTRLNPDLTGLSPDDAFSRIPYEKGSLFLFYLENIVGGGELMTEWQTEYFTDFSRKSIGTSDMQKHFINHFTKKNIDVSNVDWDHWLNGEGLPDFELDAYIDHSMIKRLRELATIWNEKDGEGTTEKDFDGMKAHQVMVFIDNLINDAKPLKKETLDKMDKMFKFTDSGNVEISVRWFLLCLNNKYCENFEGLSKYLSTNGRGVYVKPLYGLLAKIDLPYAQELFKKNENFYMEVVRKPLQKILAM